MQQLFRMFSVQNEIRSICQQYDALLPSNVTNLLFKESI